MASAGMYHFCGILLVLPACYNSFVKRSGGCFLKIYVLSRVHERHPELTSEDVLTAFRSVMEDARRADGTWVAIGLDGHGRDVEMVYKQLNDSVLIYHAMTPPTKKTLKEINQLEGKRGER